MNRQVPYLKDEVIERDAELLLVEYERARDVSIGPPIPIEDIVEKYLRLSIEFDDTHKRFGIPRGAAGGADVLGGLYFDDGSIVIDESLDPEVNPNIEGRYRFTLAHEGGGHWRLHRRLFAKDPAQTTLLDEAAPPSFICRSSQSKERV